MENTKKYIIAAVGIVAIAVVSVVAVVKHNQNKEEN